MLTRFPRRALAACALALLVPLAACTAEEGSEDAGGSGREGDGWTVLHYSMADTNLEPFMVADVNELGEVGSSEHLQIREFMDRSAGYGKAPLLDQGNWVGGRVLDLGEPGTSEVVEDLGDVDSADPEVLASFIADGLKDHRAGRYALIISDHGSSWPGMGPDEGNGHNVLDLAELTEAIASGLEQAGVDRLDLLGFDACLMANYEVASALAPYADRLVASQELEPGHGWDYRALQVLADDPDATADDFGTALVDGFAAQAEEWETGEQITLSVVDLTKMTALDEAVTGFAEALGDDASAVAAAVGRSEATTLAFGTSPKQSQDKHLSDLGLLAAAIGEEAPALAEESQAVVDALDATVRHQVTGGATADATGLSIYLPPTADLADGAYLDVSSAGAWGEFLTSYYTAGEAIPAEQLPAFTDPEAGPEVDFGKDEITLTATFDPAGLDNVTEATISYALVEDDDSLIYLGEEIASFSDDPDAPVVEGTYDLTVFEISDGEDSAYAYLDLDLNDELTMAYLDVPMTYYASTDTEMADPRDAKLSMVLDVKSRKFVSETIYLYDEESGGYGELAPDPRGLLFPDVLMVGPDGEQTWESTTDTGLYAKTANLTYDFLPLDSGVVIQADLNLYDFGGNYTALSTLVEVP